VANSLKSSEVGEPEEVIKSNDKTQRLVDWTVKILQGLLKQVVALRMCLKAAKERSSTDASKASHSTL